MSASDIVASFESGLGSTADDVSEGAGEVQSLVAGVATGAGQFGSDVATSGGVLLGNVSSAIASNPVAVQYLGYGAAALAIFWLWRKVRR